MGIDGDKGNHGKDKCRANPHNRTLDYGTEQAHLLCQADGQHQQAHHHHGGEVVVDAVHVLGHISDRVPVDQIDHSGCNNLT